MSGTNVAATLDLLPDMRITSVVANFRSRCVLQLNSPATERLSSSVREDQFRYRLERQMGEHLLVWLSSCQGFQLPSGFP